MGVQSIRLRRTGLLALLLTPPISGIAVSGPTPLLPLIEEHFGLGDAQASLVRLLITVVTIAMIVGSSLGGYVGERFGILRSYLVCLILFAVLGVATAYAPNIYWMIGLRFIFGLAAATAGVLALSMMMSNFEGAERDRWTGIFVACSTIGAIVILPMFGWLGDPRWQTAFYLHFYTLPIVALAAIGIVNQQAERVAGAPVAEQAEVKTARPTRLIAIGLLTGICCVSGVLFLPFHLRAETGASASQISIALVLAMIASSTCSAFYGTIRRHFELRTIQVGGFLLLTAGYFIGGTSTTVVPIMAAQILVGAGIGTLTPLLFLLASMIAPTALQPRFTGIARGSYFAGPMVAQILLEPVAMRAGPGAGLIGLGVIALVTAAMLGLLPGKYFHKASVAI